MVVSVFGGNEGDDSTRFGLLMCCAVDFTNHVALVKAHQIRFAGTKRIQKVPLASRSLAGTVLGVPDAENLKIHP